MSFSYLTWSFVVYISWFFEFNLIFNLITAKSARVKVKPHRCCTTSVIDLTHPITNTTHTFQIHKMLRKCRTTTIKIEMHWMNSYTKIHNIKKTSTDKQTILWNELMYCLNLHTILDYLFFSQTNSMIIQLIKQNCFT